MRTRFMISTLLLATLAHAAQTTTPAIDPATAEILEKHIEAIGGREAWKAIRTIEQKAETNVLGMTRTMVRIEDRETGRFRAVTTASDGVTENGFDGVRAWRKTPFFRGYLADSDPQARNAKQRPLRLLEYRENGHLFRRVADETIDGKTYIVIESEDDDRVGHMIKVRHYLDPQSYRLMRVTRGNDLAVTMVFDDYRTVNGVLVAFRTTSINPQVTLVLTVKEWKANVPVTDAMFAYDGEGAAPAAAAAPAAESAASTARLSADHPFGPNDEIAEALRLEAFETVWRKINDSYWDPTFGGVDWKHVHDEYLPLVKKARTSKTFHDTLDEMTGRLGKSHFHVILPDRTIGLHTRAGSGLENGTAGLELRWIDGQIVVLDVEEGDPAAAAGVKKGWVLQRVNGKTPQQIHEASLKERHGFQLRPEISRVRALSEEIGGKPGEKRKFEFLDENDRPRRVELTLKEQPIGDTTRMKFESKRLDPRIGYIRFDLFFGDLLAQFRSAVASFRDTDALIIDLRGNPGGAGDLAPALASALSSSAGSLGRSKMRYATREFKYDPGTEPYRGAVFVLVDEWSGSTSEVFVSGLQESKRIVVVGSPTAGAVLPSLIEFLPTGGALQYVISDFRTPSGRLVEGAGVKPDVEARITRASLLNGRDPVLDRALVLARQESRARAITAP